MCTCGTYTRTSHPHLRQISGRAAGERVTRAPPRLRPRRPRLRPVPAPQQRRRPAPDRLGVHPLRRTASTTSRRTRSSRSRRSTPPVRAVHLGRRPRTRCATRRRPATSWSRSAPRRWPTSVNATAHRLPAGRQRVRRVRADPRAGREGAAAAGRRVAGQRSSAGVVGTRTSAAGRSSSSARWCWVVGRRVGARRRPPRDPPARADRPARRERVGRGRRGHRPPPGAVRRAAGAGVTAGRAGRPPPGATLLEAAREVFTASGLRRGVDRRRRGAGRRQRRQPLPPLRRQGRPLPGAVRGLLRAPGGAGRRRRAGGARRGGDRPGAAVRRRGPRLPRRLLERARPGPAVPRRRRSARVRAGRPAALPRVDAAQRHPAADGPNDGGEPWGDALVLVLTTVVERGRPRGGGLRGGGARRASSPPTCSS